MTIAAHIEFSKKNDPLLLEYITQFSSQYPEHHFLILASKEIISPLNNLQNCTTVLVSPSIKNGLLRFYWFNYKLTALLTKYNASVFITENNVCSLRTNINQLMIIKDALFLQRNNPEKDHIKSYLKKIFRKFLIKSTRVLVANEYINQVLNSSYPDITNKTSTLFIGANKLYHPCTTHEKELQLELYSNGHEYFICECSLQTQSNILAVLKAFSIFKKRLKSGMQLLIINKLNEFPVKDFKNYKYRKEVQVIPYENDKKEAILIAASYAGIYLPSFVSTHLWGLQCMQSNIPLLTIEDDNNKKIFEDAAIYTSKHENKIADYLMLLYKDEVYRNVYIQKSEKLAKRYNWEDSCSLLWKNILECSNI